jgi:hypothetical protein
MAQTAEAFTGSTTEFVARVNTLIAAGKILNFMQIHSCGADGSLKFIGYIVYT